MGRRGTAGRSGWTRPSFAVLAALGLAAGSCARQAAPPGGPPDSRPPEVVSTTPEAFADVPGFRGPVHFEFNERVSEQMGGGGLDEAITVSPSSGDVRVSHGRRSLSVEVPGGFRDGVVYRVTLQTVVRDLFGNQLRYPFELVFTTGAEAEPTTVAGEVWDRITGRGAPDLTLHAIGDDSLVHLASSGEGGIYAFRYLPGGSYTLTAFQDTDLDREVGASEIQGRTEFSVASGDTLFMDVPVLAPDTTAPVLLGAEALDSATVLLRFDDFLDPAVTPDQIGMALADTLGAEMPIAARYHETAWVQHVRAVSDSLARVDSIALANAPPQSVDTMAAPEAPDSVAVADSLAARPAAADTLALTDTLLTGVPGEPARRGPPALPGPATPGLDAALARGRVLPGRRLVLVLERPLQPGIAHDILIEGVVNVNGVGGGGGEARVVLEPPGEAAAVGPGGIGSGSGGS